jgi:hypothetical protein
MLRAVIFASILTFAASAMAAERCAPYDRAIRLDFDTRIPQPRYVTTVDIAGLRGIVAKRQAGTRHQEALGVTLVETQFAVSGNTKSVSAGRGYCVYLNSVEAVIGAARPPEVYVANEFAAGSCEHRAILDHENQHVAIMTRTLREFAPRVRQELERVLARERPIYTTDPQAATDQALARLHVRLNELLDLFEETQAERNAAIDTDENYAAIGDLCRNWEGRRR